jgi:hypothetical protein
MKKLGKLTVLKGLPVTEQQRIIGGGSDTYGYDYYCPGEVIIWVNKDPYCPACEKFHEANENNSLGHNPVTTPVGEYFFNTMPHNLGWGSHVNETSGSTYIYYGSDLK